MTKEFKSKLSVGDVIKNPLNKKDRNEYVVVRAELEGGGTAHGPSDIYPDGWHITAKRLKDKTYSSKAKEIDFYQSGCFSNQVDDPIEVLRKMHQAFI